MGILEKIDDKIDKINELKMDTLDSSGRKRVIFYPNLISIMSGASEVILNKQESIFLVRSIQKHLKKMGD